jgi:hypothetical protein
LYRLVLSSDLFGVTDNPLALEVLDEIRGYVRGQMGALVGGPPTEVGSTFTAEQVIALKKVADRLLGSPKTEEPVRVVGLPPEAPKKRGRPKKVDATAPAASSAASPTKLAQIAIPESLKAVSPAVAAAAPIQAAPAQVAPRQGDGETFSANGIKIIEPKGSVNPRLLALAKEVGGKVLGNRVVKQRVDEETGELMWEQIGEGANAKLVPFYQTFYLKPARPDPAGVQPSPIIAQDVPGGSTEAANIAMIQAVETTKSFNRRIGRGGDLRKNAEVARGDAKPRTAEDIMKQMFGDQGLDSKG